MSNSEEPFSMVDNPEEEHHPKRHHLEPFKDTSKTRVLRLWLNIIFMVGAIAGLLVYFYADKEVAKYILIVSCVFKFIELGLRILKV
jgi:phage shock protein PspC (stress-responsive transcriptional regulator)